MAVIVGTRDDAAMTTAKHRPRPTRRLRSAVGSGLVGLAIAACIPPAGTPPESTDAGRTLEPTAVVPSHSPSGPSGPPSFIRPTPTPLPTFLMYVVRSGDTLTSIARRHGTTARSLAFWNREVYPSLDPDSPDYAPNRIEVGWLLRLVPNVDLDPEDLPEPSPS